MLDTGLMTAMSRLDRSSARADTDFWGRLVETAVGAHLLNTAGRDIEVTWWREGDREVDFVVSDGTRVLAIEVASGRRKRGLPGLEAFGGAFDSEKLLVGAQGLPLETALTMSADQLLAS
jgi:predicted AAA+ superfamily ATPase